MKHTDVVVEVSEGERKERALSISFPQTSTKQTILMVVINHNGYDDQSLRTWVDTAAMYMTGGDEFEVEDWQTVVV